jgi:glycosyltransferase involved in cell wall biosynthesis
MNALHVAVSGWLLGPPSGANRRLSCLVQHAAELLEPGERITVLHGPGFRPPAGSAAAWREVPIAPGPAWRRALGERRWLPTALRDVGATVLDHGFLPLPRVPVPRCLVVHDTRGADGLTNWPTWFARAVLRRSCESAEALVVPSEWTAQQLRKLAPRAAPAIVVPNGVELPGVCSTPHAAPLPPHGYVLHAGHIERRKNLEVIVRAIAATSPAARPELWLAGQDAGDRERLRRIAQQQHVGPSIRWLGPVDDAELDRLYAHARAVVVPSRHEGFGLCALEGLAHGKPVLASRAGALPEVLGDHGCLLPPDDPAAWATALAATVADSPAAANARRAHAARFGWRNAASTLVALWRTLHDRGAVTQRSVSGPAS